MLLKLHTKLALGWALIRVNFDPIQENWAKTKGWMLFCPFSRDYGTSVLFHMMSPALVFTCLPPWLAATTSGVSWVKGKETSAVFISCCFECSLYYSVVLFQIKSLEKELEEHQAYKPKGSKAKHGQLQVRANTKDITTTMEGEENY